MLENRQIGCPRKTVIVLDHTAKFLAPSKQHIDLEGGGKRSGGKKVSTAGLVYKSLWTCCAEAAVEYSRILYDLFPSRHLVQVIVSDEKAHPLNTWAPEQQCVPQLLKSMVHLGPPKEQAEESCSIMHGLTSAVQALCQPLPAKIQKETTEHDKQSRIICISSLKSEAHVNTLVACVNDAIKSAQAGPSSAGSNSLQSLDLVLLHVSQGGDGSKFPEKKPKGSGSVSVSTHSIKGSQLVVKLSALVQRHFKLRSTVVTGIPMKEEQHSGSSANYDVEILHAAGAHHELNVLSDFCASSTSSQASGSNKKDGAVSKESVILKWCTPKNSNMSELQPCVGAFRVTPVEVNSRPVACLTSFLLQGRHVMLEQPKKTGSKIISHVLASHGGDIFIHALAMSRTPLEDPPSISEGCGGRVTDYRINDFGEFMKANRLAPWSKKKGKAPLEKSLARLERCTRHWPMVISETVLGNMTQLLDPLPTLMVKETITEGEVLECKKVIYKLQAMESRNDVLPISVSGSRGKGPKRDEQYKFLWNELQVFLEAASKTSRNHEKVLDCLKGPQSPTHSGNSSPRRDAEEMEVGGAMSSTDLAWQEIGKYESMTERERTDFLRGDANNEHFYKRGHGTPGKGLGTKRRRVDDTQDASRKTGSSSSAPSLLSLWANRMSSLASCRHEEFAGRLEAKGNKAELYGHMNIDSAASERGSSVKEWV